MEIDQKTGELLVKLAREAVTKHFRGEKVTPVKGLEEKRGAFVTIHKYPSLELRGCIGFVEPIFPLWEAVTKAALNAAFNDIRFSPLTEDELELVIFEVSVLFEPELIRVSNPKEYLEKIYPGDGIILKWGIFSGVFLPQVWEIIPEKEDFLNALCEKAGLPHGSWLERGVKLYKFKVAAFREEEPYGRIIQIL
ncbi:MAG: AmmeMemoRadiSam system protein A [Candidatus Nanoarchaeia archaeon]|nr:AmmeMemoRadiSam system protein A [Candidatus Haiyanarchaeum thermophilum]MCW1303380.1 AmmeMemoRadiSam system protein A [Candidatus Haiyanarchaeum thermophilum]MCW1303933.1 AmmeMemoRadiSam system protein A [Candidatus Haiyanarchaeum thermophilum]MCW1306742.1 AmmeMemoRadiSam system protein A [Candidatus Haiyanarchaeum thermophilum]MCW1308181.1 AmmeMemoRadiSam system protein A [Candidatus Haiyanarchaeum thermophilum]